MDGDTTSKLGNARGGDVSTLCVNALEDAKLRCSMDSPQPENHIQLKKDFLA